MEKLENGVCDDGLMGEYHPHTHAKHEILKKYLDAWFNIMRYSGDSKFVYLDGFAGSGIYDGGQYGSPIIALRSLLEHKLKHKILDGSCEFLFCFIDINKKRIDKLKELIEELFPERPECVKIHFLVADFRKEMTDLFKSLNEEGEKLAPTFAFIDPYGFSDIPIYILKETMRHPKCEILVTFMSGFINRFINASDAEKRGFDDLFGTGEWRKVQEMENSQERRDFIIGLYMNQLKKIAKIKFIRSFEMVNKYNQVVYDLVFGTNHIKGLEVMKEAMWKTDSLSGCRFSDRTDPTQATLMDFSNEKTWIQSAAEEVFREFRGKQASQNDVREFIIASTPYVYRAGILKNLEETGKINNVYGRKKKGSFPKNCIIEFKS